MYKGMLMYSDVATVGHNGVTQGTFSVFSRSILALFSSRRCVSADQRGRPGRGCLSPGTGSSSRS